MSTTLPALRSATKPPETNRLLSKYLYALTLNMPVTCRSVGESEKYAWEVEQINNDCVTLVVMKVMREILKRTV